MSDVKSTTIDPIAVYCFFLAVYFLFLAGYSIWGGKAHGSGMWFAGTIFIILACVSVAVGIGIFNLNRWCWRILFFSLGVSVSTIVSLIVIFLIYISTHSKALAPYYHIIQKSPGGWVAFLTFSLTGIVVLYNLVSYEVVSYFGELGPLISPF